VTDSCPIMIEVENSYAAEHSEPEQNRFVFIYDISIHNRGNCAAQLISRHWVISDADGKIEEVRGEGVVGEQPVLEPGATYRYNSFCVLETPVGCMQGSYRMLDEDGNEFDAPVPTFTLALPGSLN